MKRLTCATAALLLTGCGGGNVAVELVPEGSGYVLGSNGAGLSSSAAARSVKVTIGEISAHLASDSGDDKKDEGGSWRVISSTRREIDLRAVSVNKGELFGDVELPAGKITQLRLRLAHNLSEQRSNGNVVLEQAVAEPDGTKCDLSVPASAFEPGLKLTGVFKAVDVEPSKRATFVIAFDLKDAVRIDSGDGCLWHLKPVIKLHDVRGE